MVRHPGSTRSDRSTSPKGITLFEVVLALAIFVGAFAAISQILNNGSRSATRSQLTSEAVVRGERRMSEVVSGVLPLQSASRVPFEDNSEWTWSLNVTERSIPYLVEVEIVVEHAGSRSSSDVNYRLTRLLRDPQVYDDAVLQTGGTVQ